MRSFQGGIERAWASGAIRSSYVVLKPESNVNIGFFAYLFKSIRYIRALQATADFIRDGQDLNFSNFCRVDLPTVPLAEQSGIVRFLDYADRRIRRYIRIKQKLINLLEEQKQAIIHQAVTRGLDPNVRLKPSGVEWLGDVPGHWEVKRLKWVTRLQRGFDLPQDKRKSGNIPVVSSGGIIDTHCESRVQGPGVVMGRYGSTDAVFYLDKDFWPHNTALFVTDFHGNDPRWCFHLLRTISKADYSSKSAVPGVDRKDLYEICVIKPPLSEQTQIVTAIDERSRVSEIVIERAQRAISLLREYRTRLFADVITGKLDVRATAASLPDELDEPQALDEIETPSDDGEAATDAEMDATPEEAEA